VQSTYTTVANKGYIEFEEKRSLFIGRAIHINNEEEAAAFIKEIKKEHRDATHNVFAYILGDGTVARYSDDGEPQGTSGMPTLEAIRKKGVTDVCVVITRYFGGILLGAGGLVRAYSHSASLALENAQIVTFEPFDEFTLRCGYSEYGKYSVIIPSSGAIIDDTDFGEAVTIKYAIRQPDGEALTKKIIEAGFGKDIPVHTGTRMDKINKEKYI
jgi:uncharacterized YigZ family protein